MTSSPCKLNNNGLREIEGLPPLQLSEANLMEEMLQFFDAYLEHLESIARQRYIQIHFLL